MSQKDIYAEVFRTETEKFEIQCEALEHKHCTYCGIVSMQNIFRKQGLCNICARKKSLSNMNANLQPSWTDVHGIKQYDVPDELSCLREGEKLLIQQISVYVPLHHLSYGQLGAKGHIVSFPQDISEVCTVLPRLPEHVSSIRVVKYFKNVDGEVSSKSFSVRKQNVLDALYWLQNIIICTAKSKYVQKI
jgi:hypothetical protein